MIPITFYYLCSQGVSNSLYLLSLNCKANMKKFILAAACLFALSTNISAQNPEKKEPVKRNVPRTMLSPAIRRTPRLAIRRTPSPAIRKTARLATRRLISPLRKLTRRTAVRRTTPRIRTAPRKTAARRTPRISSRIAARSRRSNPSSNL